MTASSSEREDYREAVCLNRARTDLNGARGSDAPELPAKNRNLQIDIFRGCGIILMVCGHSEFPLTHFVYLFHMAIFFILSGYLWNEKYSADIESCKKYLIKKIHTLYFPYVAFNIIFTLFNNYFIRLNLYTDNPNFLNLPIGPNDTLTQKLSIKSFAIEILKILLFMGGNQFAGASWFLRILFFVSILNLAVQYIDSHYKHGIYIDYLILIFCLLAAQAISSIELSLHNAIKPFFISYVALKIGVFIKKKKIMEKLSQRYLFIYLFIYYILYCFISF